jgi:hypothetical protein
MENEPEDIITPEAGEEVEDIIEEEIPEETPEEAPEKPVETPEAKAIRLLRQTNQARKKAGLAPLKEGGEPQKEAPQPTGMSTQDTIAIVRADVHTDDIPEVEDYAKYKKVTVAEALKTPFIKTLLEERKEQRAVAEATNVKTTKRGTSKTSDLDIIEKANKGEFPESAADLARARAAKLRAEAGKKS